MPRRITTGAVAYETRVTTTRRLPTTPRPSGSTRNMPRRITAGVLPTSTRANTTRRLPTSPRPSGWTRNIAEAYCNRGVAYGNKGEYDKAIADYTEAIRLEPEICRGVLQPGRGLRATRANTTRPLPTSRGHPARPEICRWRITTGAVAYGEQGRTRQGDCRLHRGHPARPEICRGVLQPGQCLREEGRIRQGDRRLHRGHPAGPESMPWRITTGAWPTTARANTTRPLPTAPRPSGSTRNMPWRITTGAWPTEQRANTTRPLPTSPRPSGSTRSMPWRITNRGFAYEEKGDHDKAIADYTEAIRLDPK